LIGDHGVFFVVGWSLMILNGMHPPHSLTQDSRVVLPHPCTCSFIFPAWLKLASLAALPWLISMVTIIPLVLFNASVHKTKTYSLNGDYMLEDVMCMLIMPRAVLLTVTFMSLYLPFYVCVTALVAIIICQNSALSENCSTPDERNNHPDGNCSTGRSLESHLSFSPERYVQTPDSGVSLLALCLPNAVYLVCYTPLLVHTWLHMSGVYTPNRAYFVALFLLLSRSFLLPMSWLSFPDVRQNAYENMRFARDFMVSFCPGQVCCLRSRGMTSSTSSVTFSRLQENPNV
ncbi:hypothetical protein EGW08_009292, partial [Elysia chlorotica]